VSNAPSFPPPPFSPPVPSSSPAAQLLAPAPPPAVAREPGASSRARSRASSRPPIAASAREHRLPQPSASAGSRLALVAYYLFASRLPDRSFPGGRVCGLLRERLCRRLFAAMGGDVDVGSHVFIGDGRFIRIGSRSGLGSGSRVYGAIIGEDVICGPSVLFLRENHRYDDRTRPIRSQGFTEPALPVVGDGAWIGERAIILPGRRIGEGAIVGAGAVVTRDVSPYEIVGGNPARPIGQRDALNPRQSP